MWLAARLALQLYPAVSAHCHAHSAPPFPVLPTCSYLATEAGPQGHDAVVACGRVMLGALRGSLLVREALASAAVVLWAAASLPQVGSVMRCMVSMKDN